MFASTDGLPGPVKVNRFGKPRHRRRGRSRPVRPRLRRAGARRGPSGCRSASSRRSARRSRSRRPARRARMPSSVVRPPRLVIASIGSRRRLTSSHVVAVERLVVAGVGADALGADRVVGGDQVLGDRGSSTIVADLRSSANSPRDVVGRERRVLVREGLAEQHPAVAPARLEHRLRPAPRRSCRAPSGGTVPCGEPAAAVDDRRPTLRVVAPDASAASSSVSGRLGAGTLKLGVRWNTVSCAACSARSGSTWMPEEPVPITPTRLPREVDALARPARGVVASRRRSRRGPGCRGGSAPTGCRWRRTGTGRGDARPCRCATRPQRRRSSSNSRADTAVSKPKCRRRSKRSATCSR